MRIVQDTRLSPRRLVAGMVSTSLPCASRTSSRMGPKRCRVRWYQVITAPKVGFSPENALLRAHDPRPGLPVIGGAIHPRRHVALGMPVKGGVGRAGLVAARLDPAHPRGWRQSLHVAGQVGPRFPAVARELHVAVVG